jgi:hypothetical protein
MTQKNPTPTYMFLFHGTFNMDEMSPQEMQQSFQKWMTWIQNMKAKGQYLAGDPLERQPAKVVRGPHGGKLTDGPYSEAKEIVGGYMHIAASSFDEAIAISRDCPALEAGGAVEVRQIMPLPM